MTFMMLLRVLLGAALAAACSAGGAAPKSGERDGGGLDASAGNSGTAGTATGGTGASSGTGGASSGGSSNAGSGGSAGGGGSGGGGGASGPCSATGMLFCDDFEQDSVGVAPSGFVIESGGGTPGPINVTADTAHSGSHSVFVDGNVFSSHFTVKGAPVFPLPQNSMYVRVYIRVGSAFTSGHGTFFETGPDETLNNTEIRVGFHVEQLEVNRMPGDAEQLSNGGDYNDAASGIKFVPGTWHCLEVLFDGQNDELRVWFEDSEVPELHVTDWKQDASAWSPTYEAVRFGYEKYSAPSMQVWYDDIAIGTSRIGCGG
jgi:hypothetical protein